MEQNLEQKYIDKVEKALDIASDIINTPELLRTKLNEFILNKMKGKSSKEMRIFFNELVDENSKYLQIGGLSYGHTFISALFENNPEYAVGIDHYGGPLYASDIQDKLVASAYYCGLELDEKVFIIRDDYFKLNQESKSKLQNHKFNVVYYCAEDVLEYTARTFIDYYDFLEDTFIFVAGGAKFENTMDGIKIGIEKTNLKIVKDWFLEPVGEFKRKDCLSWYNGLYVAVLQK